MVVHFYFRGCSQAETARLLRLKPGTVGKRLHSARVRLRRRLPAELRGEFMRVAPSRAFTDRVRLGLYDDYLGEYRFRERPDAPVFVVREGDALVSVSGTQRNVLAAPRAGLLVTGHYDGEGRFARNARGEVDRFVYYEFGRRLGVAWKVAG